MPASGGTVQTIVNNGGLDPRGASWSRDDTILFGTGNGGVYRVAAAGGTPQPVTDPDSVQEGSHRWPQFLPDGRHFLFTVRSGPVDHRGVYVGTLDGPTRHLLIHTDGNASYVAPGYLLFLDEDTLLAQPFDAERLNLAGQPTPVAARVGRSSRGDGAFATSTAGTLAYAGVALRTGRLTWFDRAGTAAGLAGPEGDHDYADFRLSPDNTRLAASLVNPKTGVPGIWLTDLMRGGTSPFALGPFNAAAVWSPDGGQMAFRTTRNGIADLYQKSAGAGGNDQPLLTEAAARATGVVGLRNLVPTDWSSDGQFIALSSGRPPTDIWLLPVAGEKKPVSLVGSPGDQMHANFSPDGRFIAYSSNESGRYDVWVETLPLSDRKWAISTDGGYEPRWRADGREIYYLSEDRTLMAVAVSVGSVPFGAPRPLFKTEVHAGVSVSRTHYVPSRDGTRFLVHTRSRDLGARLHHRRLELDRRVEAMSVVSDGWPG